MERGDATRQDTKSAGVLCFSLGGLGMAAVLAASMFCKPLARSRMCYWLLCPTRRRCRFPWGSKDRRQHRSKHSRVGCNTRLLEEYLVEGYPDATKLNRRNASYSPLAAGTAGMVMATVMGVTAAMVGTGAMGATVVAAVTAPIAQAAAAAAAARIAQAARL
jgi:hypothetical protein